MFSRIMPAHSPGGMQDHVQALSAGLARRGHRVLVITSGRAEQAEKEIVDGVEVEFLKGSSAGRYSSRYWDAGASRLVELHGQRHFSIIHSQSVGAFGVFARGLPRKLGLPLVTSLHGTHLDVLTTSWHTDFSIRNPLGIVRFGALSLNLAFRYLYRDLRFIRGSDVVIATSDADVWKYKTLYRLPDLQIRKVYNGIDTDLFAPRHDAEVAALRELLQIPVDHAIVLALARLQKDKGVQNAIAVLPRLCRSRPVSLVVVGDGSYRQTLERQARALGVGERVHFVGTQSLAECARYFNLCDVFVDPTLRTDGYDLTIAEAMACAKPAIVSDVGANSTLIDGATRREGILIPRGDNEALLREILGILDDPDMAKGMGEHARNKISERFSVASMVKGMENVYEQVIAAKRTIAR